MNYELIKKLAKERKISIKKLMESTDIGEQGFYKAIKSNSMTIRVLEDIAKALDVPVAIFFEDNKKAEPLNPVEVMKLLKEIKQGVEELNPDHISHFS